jgi:hypothetical protein
MRRRRDTPPYIIFQLKTKTPEALPSKATPRKGFVAKEGHLRVFFHLIRAASLSDIS